ncbi:hypothetical protein [Methylobacterium sp. ARG-1]|uniref:hypothetical protein n=1 Tax=Methylobacterium sp. ARG-1 TaxID=1692501 RepID=UPI000AFB17DA|nr:hypothetical protein [Methylobacterium sp. ARG-1]
MNPIRESGPKAGDRGPAPAVRAGPDLGGMRAFEYRSARTWMGLPLVHIVYGPIWLTGFRPACGILAVGNLAIGVVAIGGIAVGGLALGGIGLGLICLGGIALGLGVGLGGVATGYVALGGVAAGFYALGGVGIGAHTLQNDPGLLHLLGLPTER